MNSSHFSIQRSKVNESPLGRANSERQHLFGNICRIIQEQKGREIVSFLCGAGMKNACDVFGFSLMIGSRFSWRFCIKDVGMVKQKRHVDMSGCGNRMCGAMHSPQNLSCCTAELKKNHSQPTDVLLISHCRGSHLFSISNTQMSHWVNTNQLVTTDRNKCERNREPFSLVQLGFTWLLQLI